MRDFLVIFFFAIFTVACNTSLSNNKSNPKSASSYCLKLNPTSGSSFKYRIENETEVKMEVNDKKIDKINRVSSEVIYHMIKDTSGNFIIQIRYDSIHVHTKNGDEESDIDASNATYSINIVERMLGALKNALIECVVTSLGEIKAVKGYNELGAKLINEIKGADTEAKKMTQDQWEKIIGDEVIKKNIGDLFAFVHDSSIRVGDAWTIKTKQSSEMPILVSSKYELSGINSGVANLDVTSQIANESKSINYLGNDVTIDLKGKEKGEYRVNIKTGMLNHFNAKSNIDGIMEIMGKEIPIAINKRTEISQIEVL